MSLHLFAIEDEPTIEHDPDLIERYYRAQARLAAFERAVAREREVVESAGAELRAAALLDGPSYVHSTAPASSDGPRSVAV